MYANAFTCPIVERWFRAFQPFLVLILRLTLRTWEIQLPSFINFLSWSSTPMATGTFSLLTGCISSPWRLSSLFPCLLETPLYCPPKFITPQSSVSSVLSHLWAFSRDAISKENKAKGRKAIEKCSPCLEIVLKLWPFS